MEINQIENVLSQAYLEVLRTQLNNLNPFFAKIKRSNSAVYGNKVVLVKASAQDKYQAYLSDLATNMYSITIPDKVVRSYSNGNSQSMVALLNEEFERLLSTARKDLTRQLLSDGSSVITKVLTTTEDGDLVVENCNVIYPGQYIKLQNKADEITDTVISIDYAKNTIKTQTRYNRDLKDYKIYSTNSDLLGLKYLFSQYKYMGVERTYYVDKPRYSKCKISELFAKITECSDKLGTNLVLCSPELKREFTQYLVEHNQSIKTITVGEYNALDIGGVPVCALSEMRGENKIYALNTDEFEWQELCDWLWVDSDGHILRQVSNRPEYQATIIKHSQTICKDLSNQEEITIL